MASWTLFLSRKRLARSRCLLTSTAMGVETFSYRRFFRRRKRQSHPPAWGITPAETYLLYTAPALSTKTTALRPCGIGQGPLHSFFRQIRRRNAGQDTPFRRAARLTGRRAHWLRR